MCPEALKAALSKWQPEEVREAEKDVPKVSFVYILFCLILKQLYTY